MSEAKASTKKAVGLSTLALAMMNVTIIAGIGNDVQQSFYGLTSVTYFAIGAVFFFIPTGLVAAELASGWSERGGIFRWVGEGIGVFPAIACLLVLWMQTTFNFGAGIPSAAATIGFFTTNYDWAVSFAEHSHPWTTTLPIMLGWLVYYWFVCWLSTKGVKTFSKFVKYGVLLGTFLPLTVMTILCIVWLAQGHTPNIVFTPEGLIPKWEGLSTLSLAAGVLFSFAGIDMNAAYIRELKDPNKQFPTAIIISMVLAFLIFVVGTLVIAIVIPENQINLLYTLNATYRDLGATIGFPDLYLVFVYLGMANSFASLITNLAGPSFMLGQAGRSGFLPKFLQNNNKHGMPSKLMYTQMGLMTCIAFIVFFLPNVEGFAALITQVITILYLAYYVLMFSAFLRLRYTQPNRPRGFKVPGGKVGAWIVGGVGIIACVFGIVLAYVPPAQLAAEVGSGLNYIIIITCLIAAVLGLCIGIYALSRKHDWVDPTNVFSPFTWQIEGLKKPEKVLSNVPSEIMCADQNPMGLPIKRHYDPNEMVDLPDAQKHPKAQAKAAAQMIQAHGVKAPAEPHKAALPPINQNGVKTLTYAAPMPVNPLFDAKVTYKYNVPDAPEAAIEATRVPADPKAAEAQAEAAAKAAQNKAMKYDIEAEAYTEQAQADKTLLQAERRVQESTAAAVQAQNVAEQAAAAPNKVPAQDSADAAKAAAPAATAPAATPAAAPAATDAKAAPAPTAASDQKQGK